MWSNATNTTVLSIYPTSRGYAFALFESPLSPYDWGVKDIPRQSANELLIDEIEYLIERYQPEILVIEDFEQEGFARHKRIQALYFSIRAMSERLGVSVITINKEQVLNAFKGFNAVTKHQIAQVIAREIEAFSHLLPKPRAAWMSESRRQGLFDAAALALSYYAMPRG
jgi:Holliday junction resolvasome RuvABC endonuclease subunit